MLFVLMIHRYGHTRKMRKEMHVALVEEMRKAYKILVGKPERKSSLRKPQRRYKDNIKVDVKRCGVAGCRMF